MPLENTTPKHFTSTNDVTGDLIKSRSNSKAYDDNYDIIFRSKKKKEEKELDNENSSV